MREQVALMKKIIAIAAMDESRVIGFEGTIPWHIPEDMRYFRDLTMGHAVLMGRKTYESLPARQRPLSGRTNLVVSRNPGSLSRIPPEVRVFSSIEDVVEWFRGGTGELLWVIGGEQIYRHALAVCDEIFLTVVQGSHEGDAFFPEFEKDFKIEGIEKKQGFEFRRYVRTPTR